MARIIVTGVAGFIGSNLAERLIDDGHEVIGIDCFLDSYPRAYKDANYEELRARPRFSLLNEDLGRRADNGNTLLPAFSGADVVYHLAAQAGVRSSWGTQFSTYTDCNVLATQRVLELCHHAAVPRVVYASSSSVYGDSGELPLREDGPCRPISPYGVTKLAGEHLCDLYHTAFDVPVVALRFFTVYGPRQRPDMAFHKLLRAALQRRSFRVFGDGSQTRDFTYVADIVAGLVAAGGLADDRPSPPPGTLINIGGGSRVTLRQVVADLEDLLDCMIAIDYVDTQAGDVRHTAADLTKARDLLGYEPQTTLIDGLAAERTWIQDVVLARGLSSPFDP